MPENNEDDEIIEEQNTDDRQRDRRGQGRRNNNQQDRSRSRNRNDDEEEEEMSPQKKERRDEFLRNRNVDPNAPLPPSEMEKLLEEFEKDDLEMLLQLTPEVQDLMRRGIIDESQAGPLLEASRLRGRKFNEVSPTERLKNNIATAKTIERLKDEADRAKRFWKSLGEGENVPEDTKKEAAERQEEIDNIKKTESMEEMKVKLGSNVLKLEKNLKPFEERDPRETVRSIDDLAELIMDSEEDKWRRGGELAIVKTNENGTEEVDYNNFLAWVKSRIWFYDDFNPDGEINLFNEINIPTLYRSITFSEIIQTPRYFMKTIKMKDPVSGEVKQSHQTDQKLDELKEEALMEVWLFMTNHNNDATYRQAMGSEKGLVEAFPKIHYNNVFTKDRNRLLRMLKQAGTKDVAADMEKKYEDRSQGTTGKMIQRGILAYKFIGSQEQFKRVFEDVQDKDGHQVALESFYKTIVEEVFKEKIEAIKKRRYALANKDNPNARAPIKEDLDKITIDVFGADKEEFFKELNEGGYVDRNYFKRQLNIHRNEFDLLTDRNHLELFARKAMAYRYENGDPDRINNDVTESSFVNWHGMEERMRTGMKRGGDQYMFNFYKNVKADEEAIALVRKAVRSALEASQQTNWDDKERGVAARVKAGNATQEDKDLEKTIKAREKIDREHAEMWSYRFTYWTGISAANDTQAISFDKWGQEMNTRDYRIRQGNGRGPFGLQDTVWGIRRLTMNFWDALKVKQEGGRAVDTPLIEVIQGGEGKEVNLKKDIGNFDFEGNAQRQYLADHVGAGFKLAGFLIDGHGMNFDKIFTHGYAGKLLIDFDKAREIIQDSVWHDLRYAFDQGGFNWDKKIWTWVTEHNKETNTWEVKWGEKTLREYCFDKEVSNMKMFERKGVPDGDGNAMARNVFAFLVGKEIGWHVKDSPGALKWGLPEIHLIKEYFETWGYGLTPIYDKEGNVITLEHGYEFFSEEEWEELLEKGQVNEGKMKMNLLLYMLWLFGASALWGSVKESRKLVADAGK